LKHYSLRTEQAYVDWIKRYILFHKKQPPKDLGAVQVKAFLEHLAIDLHVAASTQNQALNALVFLYREIIHQDFGDLGDVLGHKDVTTTMVYTHAMNKPGLAVRSPLDMV
jgi:site-specific recombinase XerD